MPTKAKISFVVNIPSNTPRGSEIYFASNINNWNPGDENFKLTKIGEYKYRIDIEAEAGTYIEFKFTRGSWFTVEKGPSGEELSNRTLLLTRDTTIEINIASWRDFYEKPVERKHTISGNVLTFFFESKYLKHYNPRKIWIYLPPDYYVSEKRYPVLYMHDGQNLFDEAESFAGEWKVDETLENLYATKGQFGVIVVGIENAREFRIYEYSPYINKEYSRGGEGELYINFIKDELKPYIDSAYRTIPEKTGIMGSSLGGLISIYAGFKYPDIFKYVASLSGAFWFNPEIIEFINTSKSKPKRIYLDYGLRESEDPKKYVLQNLEIVNTLKQKGYKKRNILVIEDPEGVHHESAWSRRFPEAVLFLFSN